MIDLPSLDPVDAAIAKLEQSLATVEHHVVPISDAAGFVVAEDIRSDRDSPSLDVSAMDGFAIRLSDFASKPLPIVGIAAAGNPPLSLPQKSAIRIFTGAPVPTGADTVLVRECASEKNNEVDFDIDTSKIRIGQNVRKQGENAPVQHLVIRCGTFLSANAMAALATFGPSLVSVYRKLRVSIINTGDELVMMGEKAEAWQIRDSNGPYLEQFLRQQPWVAEIERRSVGDDQVELGNCIRDSLARADVVLLTGGVSMGDYDYVPEMIRQSGCRIEFHRLPIRPGKPVLGAVGPKGQLVCGLPGNPVSVAVTARRIAIPLMRKIAGLPLEDSIQWRSPAPNASIASVDLIHYRLCNINTTGECDWTPMMGSGDVVALSQSDGFLELPPNHNADLSSEKRFRFYPW
ncbi:MAG: molybdopterin molybdotransferase MoeA [Planctomycetota bacterium]|nr:molybdopterin molybdotransferase MoeA [Planctomycetota bacterium]